VPELTVTIVTFKTDLSKLKEAIESVLSEINSVFVIVADNDSGEDYFNALRHCLSNSYVNVLSTKRNGGYGFGHNYAERNCPPSSFHLVMNADVLIHDGALNKMIDYMKKNPSISILAPKVLNPDGSLQYLNKREPTLLDFILRRIFIGPLREISFVKKRLNYFEMRDIGYDNNYDLNRISGCFMLFDRTFFQKVNGFDENFFMYFEDFDLCRRISDVGGRISFISNVSITHYWERGSSKDLKLFISLVKSMVIYFNKWGWKFW
jgi:GT2 family glycosyltransferase